MVCICITDSVIIIKNVLLWMLVILSVVCIERPLVCVVDAGSAAPGVAREH